MSVDRFNLRSAIKSMGVLEDIGRQGRSLLISPEGKRRRERSVEKRTVFTNEIIRVDKDFKNKGGNFKGNKNFEGGILAKENDKIIDTNFKGNNLKREISDNKEILDKNIIVKKSGNLLPFKKGPFHIAKNSGLRIIPIIFVGGQRLLGKGKIMCESGTLYIKFLEPITKEIYFNMSVDELKDYNEEYFEKFYEFKSDNEILENRRNYIWHFFFVIFEIIAFWKFFRIFF